MVHSTGSGRQRDGVGDVERWPLALGAVDTADFDYELPARPASPRCRSSPATRPGCSSTGATGVEHRHVRDLPDLLDPGDLLVVNTTRVLPARLHLVKPTGGAVEVLLLEQRTTRTGRWEALVRPGRRVAAGHACCTSPADDRAAPGRRWARTWATACAWSSCRTGAGLDLLDGIEAAGEMPLPPYIHAAARPTPSATRPSTPIGRGRVGRPRRPPGCTSPRRCSTGSPSGGSTVADGRAGRRARHLPARSTADKVEDHQHARRALPGADRRPSTPASTPSGRGGRVVAVGTTTVRALESAAPTGELEGRTELFIHAGFEFRVVDRLLTNFHLPRSSLLVMIDAFVGATRWRGLYDAGPGRRLPLPVLRRRHAADPPRRGPVTEP